MSGGTGPYFSVVIPCRDDQDGLDGAVASVLAQTDGDFEVIVVDDGSDPPLVVSDDPRVQLVRREVAGGPAVARNAGLERAVGSVIAFCDSDDLFAPTRLERARAAHRIAPVAICEQGRLGEPPVAAPRSPTAFRPLHSFIPSLGATTILRADCPPFDPTFLASQDVEWWIRVAQTSPAIEHIEDVGYIVRRSPHERILNSHRARLEFSYELLDRHADFFAADRTARAFRWRRIATMERTQGNLTLAVHALARAALARPSASLGAEGLRTLRSVRTASAPPENAGALPVPPPFSRVRGRALRPRWRGTSESRVGSLRHRPRGGGELRLRTWWGTWVCRAGDRPRWPYVDEPLATMVWSRLVGAGDAVVDVGAGSGWWSLVAAARVGPTGHVVAVEPDAARRSAIEETLRIASRSGGAVGHLADVDRADVIRVGQVPAEDEQALLRLVGDRSASVRAVVVAGAAPVGLRTRLAAALDGAVEWYAIDARWGGLQPTVAGDASDARALVALRADERALVRRVQIS